MFVIFASCTVVSSTVPVSSLTSTLILLLQKLFKMLGSLQGYATFYLDQYY